jgi:hypothetical protein
MCGRRSVTSAGLLALLLALAACDKLQDGIEALNKAIDALDRQSTAWQQTLKDLEGKLTADVQSTMKNEVDQVLQRGIAATGTEFRCDSDFIANRVRAQIKALLPRWVARRDHKPEPPPGVLPPQFCQVNPLFVDIRIDPSRRNVLAIYGYDLDVKEPNGRLTLALVDRDQTEQDVTNYATITTHYQMSINIAKNGVPFKPTSDKLVLRWNSQLLSTVPITRDAFAFRAVYSSQDASPSDAPSKTARTPVGFTMIGGGCRLNIPYHSIGQLLAASFPQPDGSGWTCMAKAHKVSYPSGLTAFVLAVPNSLHFDVKISQATTPNAAEHPTIPVSVANGYTLIGGGCQTTFNPNGGNYLFQSYPSGQDWLCTSKMHDGAGSYEKITAYAIGLKTSSFDVVRTPPANSAADGWPSIFVPVPAFLSEVGIVGGGCNVMYTAAGNMLFASFPDEARNQWACFSKDHGPTDQGTIAAYAFGLKERRH